MKSNIRAYTAAFFKHNHLMFAASVVFSVLGTGMSLMTSWLLGEILDCITLRNTERLQALFWLILAAVAGYLVIDTLMYFCKSAFIHKALAQYKSYAFEKISSKSIHAFFRENTGRYLSVLTNDVNSIEENYLNRTILIFYHVASFTGALAMMLFYSRILTLVVILFSALPVLPSMIMGKGLAVREKAVSDSNERFMSMIRDLLSGFSVVKSFKAEGQVAGLFNRMNRAVEKMKQKRRFWDGILTTLSNGCGMLFQFAIFLAGAWLALKGQITGGTVLIFVNLCNYIMQPIQIVPQYFAGRNAAEGLIEKLSEITEQNREPQGTPIPPVLTDSITFDHVSFGYEPKKEVLHDLSFTIQAGKKYAVAGASGSGKSTLLNLLMGAYSSYEGSICVDGAQLHDADADSLYDVFSLVGQNVFLFDDTIRNNITMFREFSDQKVEDVIKRSGLLKMMEEKGMDYRCMENGVGLSGGERQRISIARCLMRNTPVLMLDEATAALDNQTAFEITDAILHLDGLTRLVVTHRLERALMEQYDGIFVLRDGRLAEQGTFEELMEKKGYFYSLFMLAA